VCFSNGIALSKPYICCSLKKNYGREYSTGNDER
jgi:hypothetical protein